MKKGRTDNKDRTIVRSLAYGIPVCLGVTLGGVILTAALVNAQRIPWEATAYWIMGITILAAFTGSIVSAKLAGKKMMIVSAATGIGYFLILLGCNALLLDGQYDGVGETLLLILGTCICTALLTVHKKGKNNRSVKRRNR
jgi:putative membrane protein (TIGR04086 family)